MTWIIVTAGLASIAAHRFVRATLDDLQHTLAKPVTKEPITVDMLEAIASDAERSGCLTNLRLAKACLVSFSGILRFDKLMQCDFVIQTNMMSVKIVPDQLCQGDSVVIARTVTSTCPVAKLEYYLTKSATPLDDERFLFHPIQCTKNGEVLRISGRISYSHLGELKAQEPGGSFKIVWLTQFESWGSDYSYQCSPSPKS